MSILIFGVILFALIYFLIKELIFYFGQKRMLKIVEDYDNMQKPSNFYRKIVETIARDEKPIPYRLFTTQSQIEIVDDLISDGYLKFVVDDNGETAIELTEKVLL